SISATWSACPSLTSHCATTKSPPPLTASPTLLFTAYGPMVVLLLRRQLSFDRQRIVSGNASIAIELRAPRVRACPSPSALLCASATPLEGWSGLEMAATNAANSSGQGGEGEKEGVDTLKVRDAKDVEQAVREAVASEQPL